MLTSLKGFNGECSCPCWVPVSCSLGGPRQRGGQLTHGPPGAALPQCCVDLSQGLSRLPSVPPPRDARASLASSLNGTKGTRRRFPELIPLLNTWKSNQQVPPGPACKRGDGKLGPQPLCSGHPVPHGEDLAGTPSHPPAGSGSDLSLFIIVLLP